MITSEQAGTLLGARVFDRDGELVGRVGEVYVGAASRRATWLLVVDGSIPSRTHMAPCEGAEVTDAGVRLAVDGRLVEEAPALSRPPNEPITEADEARLVDHYAPSPGIADATTGPATGEPPPGAAPDAMTRSEERVRINMTSEVTGRVRVRRYVETENVQFTVPIRREKISIEHIPAEPGGSADPSPAGQGAVADGLPGEIILHEERVVIQKEIVPVERIRLSHEVVTETVTVETPLRRERIELERPGGEPERLG